VSETDTALTPARTPDHVEAAARCGTWFEQDGRRIRCDFYLIRDVSGRWFHLVDRCESCVLGWQPGQVCEWNAVHGDGPICTDPTPRVCTECEAVLNPEQESDGHPNCEAPGECCGCCGSPEFDDPDHRYDADRDAALGP
jgi:hypothetical protein